MFNNVHFLTDMIINDYLKLGDKVIDATIGNGKDSLKILNKIGKTGHLYGFDIQQSAINNSKQLLNENGYTNITLFHETHENMKNHFNDESVDMVIFNLGYLPKGDKSITTKISSTLQAVIQATNVIKVNGIVLITCYIGHDEGKKEYDALIDFYKNIDQTHFNVFHGEFINQKNNPPKILLIEKRISLV